MKYDAIKKRSGQWVRIRPALQIYDRSAVLRSTVEDAWLVSEITESTAKIESRDTKHSKVVGLDHVHNYMADPEGERTLGTTGMLVMNVQLLLYEDALLTEPVAPPGTALRAFVPAKPRKTLFDAAAKMRAQAEFEEASRRFSASPEGIAAADKAFADIPSAIRELEAQLKEAGHPVQMTVKQATYCIVLGAVELWVRFVWERPYANTLDLSCLIVDKWDGHPPFPGARLWQEPTCLSRTEYTFGLAALNQPRWLPPADAAHSYTTLDLVQKMLTDLLEHPKRKR